MPRSGRDIHFRGSARPDEKPFSGELEAGTAPTAQELCFQTGIVLCLALCVALTAQLLLGGG
jgi:hypothetical protein